MTYTTLARTSDRTLMVAVAILFIAIAGWEFKPSLDLYSLSFAGLAVVLCALSIGLSMAAIKRANDE